jgi:hypothetical protein
MKHSSPVRNNKSIKTRLLFQQVNLDVRFEAVSPQVNSDFWCSIA